MPNSLVPRFEAHREYPSQHLHPRKRRASFELDRPRLYTTVATWQDSADDQQTVHAGVDRAVIRVRSPCAKVHFNGCLPVLSIDAADGR